MISSLSNFSTTYKLHTTHYTHGDLLGWWVRHTSISIASSGSIKCIFKHSIMFSSKSTIRYPLFAFSVKMCKIAFCSGFFYVQYIHNPAPVSLSLLYVVFRRKSNWLNNYTVFANSIHHYQFTSLTCVTNWGLSYPCASMKWNVFRIEHIDAFQIFSAKCEIEWNW